MAKKIAQKYVSLHLEEKAPLPQLEEKILEFWQENKIFEKSVEQRKNKKRYVFYDGPPFATGLPHYGHILASTIKDVVPRFWTMRGFRVDRRWGWDTHGLPIENLVEQELKISGRKAIEQFGIGKFNDAARSKVLMYTTEWKKTVERIGRFVDFENAYTTMDPTYMESVWWAFAELHKKGLVYKDSRTSLFCPRCETPLSNFEIAMDNSYRDQEDDSVFVKLKLKDANSEYLLVWTTTPWTLPGNAAVAVNPSIEYTKFKIGSEYIWAATTPPHEPGTEVAIVEKAVGRRLVGRRYHPLFLLTDSPSAYRVVEAAFVGLGEGTGLVHIAPAFGEEDFLLGKKEKLPMLDTLDDTGKFTDTYPALHHLAGKKTVEANPLVIEWLKKEGALWKVARITHRYPICWRCQTPLIYKVQPAWFVKIAAVKKKMLALNKKIDWHPLHLGEGRFGNGLEMAPDWNVSRSRFWGTPLPIWECESCGKAHIVGSRRELAVRAGKSANVYTAMRHAESVTNVKGLAGIRSGNFPLTLRGRVQAERAARKLKRANIDLIFSSTIQRAEETAQIIADVLGKKVHFDERLNEVNTGVFENNPVKKYHAFFSSTLEKFTKASPGGETLRDLRARTLGCIEELERKYKGKRILMVGHDYPIWLMYAGSQGLTDRETVSLRNGEKSTAAFIDNAETLEISYKKLPRDKKGEINFHRPYTDAIEFPCSCGGRAKRIPDVLDCWFESGSMPFAQIHYPFENKNLFEKNFPADFISEYIAQTRGWFYTLHVLSTALFSKPAFSHVVTTGVILSEKGEKLSKSRQNFPDPRLLFEKYGVDAMRLYLMSASVMLADNVNFSEREVDELYKKYSLIAYNVLNLYRLYAHPLPAGDIRPRHVLDRWIQSRLHSTLEKITRAYERYEILEAVRPLLDFVQDLSLWYVRRSRERIKAGTKDSHEATATLHAVLRDFARMAAPVTPFLAEIIYLGLGRREKHSVHLEDWPRFNKAYIDRELETRMSAVRTIVSEALRARADAKIKVRQPLAGLVISEKTLAGHPEFLELIKEEINVKRISFGDALRLDTEITPELKAEGYMRELVRNVQELRRNLGLKPDRDIRLQVSGDERLVKTLFSWEQAIKKETRSIRLKIGGKKEFKAERELDFEGAQLWIGIDTV